MALSAPIVDIVFDNCLKVEGIKVIKDPTGLFISFPSKKQRDGTYRNLASPANAETRMMIPAGHPDAV
jgi:stage V sporulation protein G